MQIKLFLNIFNYKVIFQCFHYFLFEKKIWLKNFFNYKIIGLIIIWLNITLTKQRRLRLVSSETKISIWQFYFYQSIVEWHEICLYWHIENSDYFILSIKASGQRAYCFQTLLKMEHIGKGGGGLIQLGVISVPSPDYLFYFYLL